MDEVCVGCGKPATHLCQYGWKGAECNKPLCDECKHFWDDSHGKKIPGVTICEYCSADLTSKYHDRYCPNGGYKESKATIGNLRIRLLGLPKGRTWVCTRRATSSKRR